MRKLCLLLMLELPCAGQTLPGLQFVKPESAGGRPLLVATPCAAASNFGEMSWVSPIMVYEDSLLALYVDQNCLNAAVQTGFGESGKYMVAMYSHYKSSDYPCKVQRDDALASMSEAERREFQTKYAAEYQRECKLLGYRVRWIDVDTRAKKFMVTRKIELDIEGFHAFDVKPPAKQDWSLFSDLQKVPVARPTVAAIERTTKLIEKEQAYWDYRNKR